MNIVQDLIINIILVLFPLFVYLFYALNREDLNLEKNKSWLDFSLLSSLYLSTLDSFYIFYFIVLFIAYNKDRQKAAIILSLFIAIQYSDLNILIFLLILFTIYKINSKILIKYYIIYPLLIITLYTSSIQIYIIHAIVFIITFLLITYVYNIIESIIKIHYSVKDIVKEQRYQTSLFKITHEIKNPIAVCKSYLDMFDINNKDHKRYIPILKEEMDKILILLQDFLFMNKIKINKELIDITVLIDEIMDHFKDLLTTNDVTFNYEVVDDEIYIEGDYNRLNQVLVNVIKNALESKEDKLNIKIKTEKSKNNFIITIKDTGCGFNMKDLEKIKEPFYTTKINGTGLGVSLSNEIIKAHNGSIEYFSEIKKGTTVVIKLPIVHLD